MFSCLRHSDCRESDGMGHVCRAFRVSGAKVMAKRFQIFQEFPRD